VVFLKNDRVYGRGTEDNQQDMVASIFAAKAFLDEGMLPEKSIGLAFVSDEETSSLYGLTYVMDHSENPFRKTDLILVPDLGNADGTLIEIVEKSIFWLRFKTIGKQCHASIPNLGKNAFQAASHLVVRLNDLHHIFNARNLFFEPPLSTFQPTKKEANIPNINTIPGEDVFYIDGRILPEYPLSEVFSEIRSMADEIERKFGVTIEITPIQQLQAALYTKLRNLRKVMARELWQPFFDFMVILQPYGLKSPTWPINRMRAASLPICWEMQKCLPTYSSKGESPRDKSVASKHFE
jgi:succinyl-diaminopimelate desuccinylase